MKDTTRAFVLCVVVATLLSLALLFLGSPAEAETVCVSIREGTYLNGRMKPSTKSSVTMRLFNGDELEAVALAGEWVEVIGGESGTSFVKAQYLNEIKSPVYYRNISNGRVRVRKTPEGNQTVAWIPKNKCVKVSRQLMGWGRINDGWIDLQYFQKEE